MMTYYIYEDWTLEPESRCFYVGKGKIDRVRQLKRNRKHSWVMKTYGLRREIVIVTSVESVAFNHERDLIAERKTFFRENSFGCNFTRGGEGTSGHRQTVEARQKMSEWRKGRPGHRHSEETKTKMSRSKKGRPPNNLGKPVSSETRARLSAALKGRPKSEAWKRLMSERMKGNTNGRKKSDVDFG